MNDKSHAVIRLPVHLPNQQSITIHLEPGEIHISDINDQITMLLEYFALNKRDTQARKYYYVQIPQFYTYKSEKVNGKQIKFWSKRVKHFNCLGRIYSVSPTNGELFHLRLLLLRVKGAQSFDELKTFNGIYSETFVQACLTRGLIEDDQEWRRCLQEANYYLMPRQLRG